jgi:hypothetical protein
VVHLAHPYDRKLPKASSVSLDRLFCVSCCLSTCFGRGSPLHHGFLGGPSKWHQLLPAGVGLHTLLSFPLFPFQVRFALFCVRPWKDGLSFCPVETVGLILQGRGRLHLTQNAIFFSWMRLCVFWTLRPSIAAFLRCLLSWHPGNFWFHRFGRRFRLSGPWRTFLVLFHVSAAKARPGSFPFCHALCGLVGSHEFSLGWIAYMALPCQTQQPTDRIGRDTCLRDESTGLLVFSLLIPAV